MITEFPSPKIHRRFVLKSGALASALVAAGSLRASVSAQEDDSRANLRFIVVSHGQASDPFWSVVQRGVEQAGEDMGVDVQYQAPGTFDMVAMSQLIEAA